MSSLTKALGGGKKAPALPPQVEREVAPTGVTRLEKMEASRIRARRTGSRALLGGDRLGPQAEGEPVKTTLGAG